MKRDRFIPLRKVDVIKACIDRGDLSATDKTAFSDLCQLMVSTLHYEYHQQLESLKDSYAPFDPNSDTLQISKFSKADLETQQTEFASTFADVLNAANFKIYENTGRQSLL